MATACPVVTYDTLNESCQKMMPTKRPRSIRTANETRIWVNVTDRNKVLFLSKHIHYDTILKSLMLTSSLPTWPYSQAKQRKWNICFLRVPWDLAFMAISAFNARYLKKEYMPIYCEFFLLLGSCKVSAQEPNIHWRMSNKVKCSEPNVNLNFQTRHHIRSHSFLVEFSIDR